MRIIWSDLSGVTPKHKLQLQVLKNDNSTEIATSDAHTTGTTHLA